MKREEAFCRGPSGILFGCGMFMLAIVLLTLQCEWAAMGVDVDSLNTEVQKLEAEIFALRRNQLKKPITNIRTREDLGKILELEGFKTGAEVGVFFGEFTRMTLVQWKSCTRFLLVDPWLHQENYKDLSNLNNSRMEQAYQHVRDTIPRTFQSVDFEFCRNFSVECAVRVPDESLDFVYVDARHDFKGVLVDLAAWWPKVRVGGIMAGHDYVTQAEVGTFQNWTVNYDGTIDETGTVVRGAVNKFFSEGDALSNVHLRQITVSYKDFWGTWMVRK